MTDIVLVPVTGGSNLSAINSNFDKIEEAINTDVLHLKGGNNVMKQDLDLNGHQLLNHETDLNDPDSLINVGDADARYYNVSGDTLTGNMNAAGNKILNLPVANAPHEPMRKNEVDAANAAQDAVTATNNSKAIRTPEAIPALGNAASRADKLLSFDNSGNPVAIAAANQSATDLELRLANNVDPAKGVALLGYLERNLYQKLQDAISIKDFGAVGNGSTDDTTDIAAAFSVAGVYEVPKGTYRLTSAVTLAAGSTLIFNGGHFDFDSGALRLSANCTVIDASISGSNKTNAASGITLTAGADNCLIIRPKISAVQNNAIDNSAGADNLQIFFPKFSDIGGAGIDPTFQGCGIYSSGANGTKIFGGEISETRGQGAVFIDGGSNASIEFVDIHDTFFRGVNLWNNPTKCIVRGNKIARTGEINDTGSGVGCNGIFCVTTNHEDAFVCDNWIEDVAENGIEGNGQFINNVINRTGYRSLTTPSKEGIFLDDSTICKGNIIIDAVGDGIKSFVNTNGASADVSDNKIYSPGLIGVTIIVDGAGISYGDLNVQANIVYGANIPGNLGFNITRSGGATFVLSKSFVRDNISSGRASNSVSITVGNVTNNSFDPKSATIGDASATAAKSTHYTLVFNTPLTATRGAQANIDNPSVGDIFHVVRTAAATGAFNVNVNGNAGALKGLSAAAQWATAEYVGTAWVLTAFGSL